MSIIKNLWDFVSSTKASVKWLFIIGALILTALLIVIFILFGLPFKVIKSIKKKAFPDPYDF